MVNILTNQQPLNCDSEFISVAPVPAAFEAFDTTEYSAKPRMVSSSRGNLIDSNDAY
jgi:hypothetical protein